MIGIIGSADSVELALTVAGEMGLADAVVGRAYRDMADVPVLVQDLEQVCRALLFTGLVPFRRAASAVTATGTARAYVPHTAIDLYRAVAVVLSRHAGQVPAVSVDTIAPGLVSEVWQDLSLQGQPPVLPLEDESGRLRAAEEVVAFHLDAAKRGEARLSLTCLGEVARRLAEVGQPVVRIEHTRGTLRDALARTSAAMRIAESRAAQMAVAVFRPLSGRRHRTLPDHVRPYAEKLRGAPTPAGDGTWTVHTTLGAVEAPPVADEAGHPKDWVVGFGVGTTAAAAESNARRALSLAERDRGPFTVLADGQVIGQDVQAAPGLRLRETDDDYLRHARSIGLRTFTLARLSVALRDIDASSVTARDLADAYGVEVRSALRLLSRLEQAGVATVRGVDGPPRAGRPQTVYRIDVARLIPTRYRDGA